MKTILPEYAAISPLGEKHCHIRFSGPFAGETINWDARLYCLDYYVAHCLTNIIQWPVKIRQFIRVGDAQEYGRQLEIGLNVTSIDEPTIFKTIIMIRQYKRLNYGQHDYGTMITINR